MSEGDNKESNMSTVSGSIFSSQTDETIEKNDVLSEPALDSPRKSELTTVHGNNDTDTRSPQSMTLEFKIASLRKAKSVKKPSHPEITHKYLDWVHPLDQHGWYVAHQAIRADFRDLHIALDNIVGAIDNQTYEKWMAENLVLFGNIFSKYIHEHHNNEDVIWFPFMKTKLPLPEQLAAEHLVLQHLQDDLDKNLNDLAKDADNKSLPDMKLIMENIRKILHQMDEYLEPHLAEEDVIWLPLLLQTFTKQETKKPEQRMIATFDWYVMPHFYRGTYDEKGRFTHMNKILGIPSFVITLIFSKNFKKYDRIYKRAIDELKDFSLRKVHQDEDAKSSCVIS